MRSPQYSWRRWWRVALRTSKAAPPPDERTSTSGETDDGSGNDSDADASDEGSEATLDHDLRFSAQGLEGNVRLTLEPDGSADGQRGTAEPFSFVVSDDELAEIAASVAAADLASQPEELRGDEPDLSDDRYLFEYGDVRVEAEYQHAPDEVRELGRILTRIVRDNAPDA